MKLKLLINILLLILVLAVNYLVADYYMQRLRDSAKAEARANMKTLLLEIGADLYEQEAIYRAKNQAANANMTLEEWQDAYYTCKEAVVYLMRQNQELLNENYSRRSIGTTP